MCGYSKPKGTRAFSGLIFACIVLGFGTLNAQAATMADLLAGGSITCGDKTFSNFRNFFSNGAGGAIAPTSAEVFVNADSTNCGTDIFGQPGPGLVFQSANWNVNPGQSMDTAFTFDVTVTRPLLASIGDVSMSLLSFANLNGADIHITESMFSGVTNVGNLVVDAGLGRVSDSIKFAPPGFVTLTINKDISLEGHAQGSASLSTFSQNFSEIPEPGSLTYFGIGILGILLGSIRGRYRRRNSRTPAAEALSPASLKHRSLASLALSIKERAEIPPGVA
jgi:hypothetical protein